MLHQSKPTKNDEDLLDSIFADIDDAPTAKPLASSSASAAAARDKQSSYTYASRPRPMLSTAPKADERKLLEAAMFGKPADARKAVTEVGEMVAKDEASRFDDFAINDDAPLPDISMDNNDTIPVDESPDAGEPTSEPSAAVGTAEVQTITVRTARPGATKKASAFLPQFAAPVEAKATVVQASAKADAANWHAIRDQMQATDASLPANPSAAPAHAENVLEADGSLRFFFLDAYEVRDRGEVYLFGKVLDRASNRHVSCCILVNGIQRRLFVLPRQRKLEGGKETDIEVDIKMVYDEFDNVRSKRGIKTFRSRPVEKKYAFEVQGVPAESDYLEVAYPFTG